MVICAVVCFFLVCACLVALYRHRKSLADCLRDFAAWCLIQVGFGCPRKEDWMYNPQGPGFVMADYTLEQALASVGKGWAPIVERLWRLCKAQTPPVMIEQVKEKYGGLRFYVGGATEAVFDAIDAGEAESYTICEDCGKPGHARAGGWILTLCDECARRHGKGD